MDWGRQYISENIGTIHVIMALFIMFDSYDITDGLNLSVYSSEQWNCSLFNVTFNYCSLYTDSSMEWKIIRDIWGFLKVLNKIENFN
jgi:hypothetical protein